MIGIGEYEPMDEGKIAKVGLCGNMEALINGELDSIGDCRMKGAGVGTDAKNKEG